MLQWIRGVLFRSKLPSVIPPDGNVFDKRPGESQTRWEHVRVCTECREKTNHQEFMTQICTSCGQKMRWLPRGAAVRMIVYRGEWVEQLHDEGRDYLRLNNAWSPVKETNKVVWLQNAKEER